MPVFVSKTLSEIDLIGKKLKLEAEIINHAKQLYEQVTKIDSIKKMRTTQLSIAVATIYISSSLANHRISQYELCYKLKVSPTTIRKVYKRICESLNINRAAINSLMPNSQLPFPNQPTQPTQLTQPNQPNPLTPNNNTQIPQTSQPKPQNMPNKRTKK